VLWEKIDPFRFTLNYILDFLAYLFDKGLEYNTIAGYRSAISAYYDRISGIPVGKIQQVTSLLRGIYNKRPIQPRFNFIWDVETVITLLS